MDCGDRRSSAGEALDDQAMGAVQGESESLQAESPEARKINDTGRVGRFRMRWSRLLGQITSATGLGGRRRSVGDTLDRARKAVSMAIARTITQIRKNRPDWAITSKNTLHAVRPFLTKATARHGILSSFFACHTVCGDCHAACSAFFVKALPRRWKKARGTAGI